MKQKPDPKAPHGLTALLWAAYPDGVVEMDGIRSTGGLVCRESESRPGTFYWFGSLLGFRTYAMRPEACGGWVRRGPYGASLSHGAKLVPQSAHGRHFEKLRRAGDLLPAVDPKRTATWACLKADLAIALGKPPTAELRWVRMVWETADPVWGLSIHNGNRKSSLTQFDGIDTNDPAEALIRARAQLQGVE